MKRDFHRIIFEDNLSKDNLRKYVNGFTGAYTPSTRTVKGHKERIKALKDRLND